MSAAGVITLLTDFGTRDHYVGVMKGVIASLNPEAVLIDLTHEVPAQAVRSAGYVLDASFRFFAPGTVHLAIVDPGVGSDRKAMVLRAAGHLFVVPDNGLVTEVMRAEHEWKAAEITNPVLLLPSISQTFHGRDVFAPAAARLSAGFPFDEVGPIISTPHTLPPLLPEKKAGVLRGEVIWIDGFGNLITTVREEDLRWLAPTADWGTLTIEIARTSVRGLRPTYNQGTGLMALVGSSGRLEISVVGGSAQEVLATKLGDQVIVHA